MHAVRIAGEIKGSRVVVLGAGTIGLLCVVAALHAGAATVVVTDLDPGKLERARRAGAHGAVQAGDPDVKEQVLAKMGGEADVVLDCVTNERSLNQAVSLLRRAGTLAVVGVPPRDAVLPMPLIQDWEIRVQGCAAYTEADMQTALTIAVNGGLPTDEIISQTYGLDDVESAFAQARADSSARSSSPRRSDRMHDSRAEPPVQPGEPNFREVIEWRTLETPPQSPEVIASTFITGSPTITSGSTSRITHVEAVPWLRGLGPVLAAGCCRTARPVHAIGFFCGSDLRDLMMIA